MPSNDLHEFCELTGRTVCKSPEYEQLVALLHHSYLEPIGITDEAPAVLVTDDRYHAASYIHGDYQGVLIDQKYIRSVYDLSEAIVSGENGVDLAVPFVRVLAHELEQHGNPVEALALRHERLSGLYAIETAYRGIEVLLECDLLIQRIDGLKTRFQAGKLGLEFIYVALHEIGHWIYNSFNHNNAIGRSRDTILGEVNHIRSTTSPEWLKKATELAPVQVQDFLGQDWETLAQEIFCDRFVCGAFIMRAVLDEEPWEDALVLVLVLQEAQRLLHRALRIAQDFKGDQSFLKQPPTLDDSVVDRAFDAVYLRSYLASSGVSSYIPDMLKRFNSKLNPVESDGGLEAETLFTQARLVFTKLTGPELERCIYLLLRSVCAKLGDRDVREFFEEIVKQYAITTDQDLRQAFERIVDRVADGLFEG